MVPTLLMLFGFRLTKIVIFQYMMKYNLEFYFEITDYKYKIYNY